MWWKVVDPDEPLPLVPPGTDLRVLVPEDERFTVLAQKLDGIGGQVRRVRHLVEDESVTTAPDGADRTRPVARSRVCRMIRPYRGAGIEVTGAAAAAARDAFDIMWQDHDPAAVSIPVAAPAETVVPEDLAGFLPFPTLNPAQSEAMPQVLSDDQNLVVVAPTGAGKTVIGMAAALRTVVQHGRKSAWLVPQRSLTEELDRELEHWRDKGLRVERLSGEHTVDIDRIRGADLWVATTEKFEAICRAAAFREALSNVGSLVVDEIHMLGDPMRGPVLEALLARIRDDRPATRIVGLSATISNADQVAEWLQAGLLRVSWRPSRLTWQLPMIAAHADYLVTEAARTRLAAAITAMVTEDGGSVLVFCGSKRNVRRTALVIAASRGVDVYEVHPDDTDRVHQVCQQARIGLHYQGWDHRQQAERLFRQRDLDVLVATSTVASGVNLPARAVVIQDTQAGLNTLDVATVQQMFGRAGRIGAGENSGWAFLIVDDAERPAWQSRLVAGHTVHSQIQSSLPEHVLSEVVQERITSQRQAGHWWIQTLAHHQGRRSLKPLGQAVEFLADAQMLTAVETGNGDRRLAATELGRLTARLMVSPPICHALRESLSQATVPEGPDQAERLLIDTLAGLIPKLAQSTVGDAGKSAVARLLAAGGHVPPGSPPVRPTERGGLQRGDLARAALFAVANSPEAFHSGVREVGGIPYPAMYPILEETPRYLHWLASQGLFGTVHPWCAVVAADLERRIRWRHLQPARGAGRLLWACEHMATPIHATEAVPKLWAAARANGYRSPDWTVAGRPRDCQLDRAGYLALLRDRATGCTIEIVDERVRATGPAGAILATWAGPVHRVTPIRRGRAVTDRLSAETGAAVFTWRGDYRPTGWLAAYSRARR
jgi:helicase